MSESQTYTLNEVAARLKVSYGTVYRMVTTGRLKGFRAGNTNWKGTPWRVTETALRELESGV
jgi:excisionase family DNA binding protein